MAQELKCRNCGQAIHEFLTGSWIHDDANEHSVFEKCRAAGCWSNAKPAEVPEPQKPLTMSQALEAFKEMFPERSSQLSVEVNRRIGEATWTEFFLWDRDVTGCMFVVAASKRSFEHALAIAKSGNEDCWPEDTSDIEETV